MNKISIKGTQTTEVDVTVTKDELFAAAEQVLDAKDVWKLAKAAAYKKLDLPKDAFMRNFQWITETEVIGSHRYEVEDIIRDVTDKDVDVIRALEVLKKL